MRVQRFQGWFHHYLVPEDQSVREVLSWRERLGWSLGGNFAALRVHDHPAENKQITPGLVLEIITHLSAWGRWELPLRQCGRTPSTGRESSRTGGRKSGFSLNLATHDLAHSQVARPARASVSSLVKWSQWQRLSLRGLFQRSRDIICVNFFWLRTLTHEMTYRMVFHGMVKRFGGKEHQGDIFFLLDVKIFSHLFPLPNNLICRIRIPECLFRNNYETENIWTFSRKCWYSKYPEASLILIWSQIQVWCSWSNEWCLCLITYQQSPSPYIHPYIPPSPSWSGQHSSPDSWLENKPVKKEVNLLT